MTWEDLKYLSAPDWTRWFECEPPSELAIIVQVGDDSRLELALETTRDIGSGKKILLIISGGSCNNPTILARQEEHPFSFAPELAKRVPELCKKLGIEEPTVVVEPNASNTLECAKFTLPILIEHQIKAAIIAMTPQHMLRCLLTARKWFNENGGEEIALLTAVSAPVGVGSPDMREDTAGELLRIEKYSKKGDCYPDLETALAANPGVWTLF